MITIANANALHIPLPDRSVQCVVTSPPYWGLRDYGTAKWEGGSAECDHVGRQAARQAKSQPGTGNAGNVLRDGANGIDRVCAMCGAIRIDAQIGLESTPAEYVAHIVAVMRECWRVLKPSGTLWLILGDSYNGSGSIGGTGKQHTNPGSVTRPDNRAGWNGLKPKDLCGIPWRVAFALQDDGWYLRSDIIWHKPNPMPESVTDRPTKAHEYVFLLTKQARYFYDAEAIKEAADPKYAERYNYEFLTGEKETSGGGRPNGASNTPGMKQFTGTRNRRSVWTIATSPYSGAHFATFPAALIEPCILAGTSARGECPHCGKAWVRVVETVGERQTHGVNKVIDQAQGRHGANSIYNTATVGITNTIGWRPSCACPPHDPIPQTVLDPFAGSGTTGQVAVKHGRRAVLLDLNTKYIDLQFERTNGVQVTMPL